MPGTAAGAASSRLVHGDSTPLDCLKLAALTHVSPRQGQGQLMCMCVRRRLHMGLMCQQGDSVSSSSSSKSGATTQEHTLTGHMLARAVDTLATMLGLREPPRGLLMMRGPGSLWSMVGLMAPTNNPICPQSLCTF